MGMGPTELAARFEEAARTLRQVPVPGSGPRGYGSSWPDYVRDAKHAYGYNSARIKVVPSPDEISRMDEALEWLKLVEPKDARIIWMRAEGKRWMQVCRVVGCSRGTAWRHWTSALLTICKHLNSKGKRARGGGKSASGAGNAAQRGAGRGSGGAR